MEMTSKKLKMLNEKQSKLTKELEQVQNEQNNQVKSVMSEFELAKRELDRVKKESQNRLDDLKRLAHDNKQAHSQHYEQRVEELERQLREADAQRKDFQMRLEFANINFECKLKVFVKDSEEKQRQNYEQMKKIQSLVEDFHQKSLSEA